MKRKKLNSLAFWLLSLYLINISIVQETYSFIVLECPGSTVPSIRQQTRHNEISAIFHYTNWNSKSLDVYTLYDDLSGFYSDYIYFAAIDCGHRMCNCSFAHIPRVDKVSRGLPTEWPTLIVYVQINLLHTKNIIKLQYFGAWRLTPLMHFFNYLLNPIERIYTKQELNGIRLEADKVILGLFNDMRNDEDEYRNYALASIHWLEYDYKRSCRFMAAFGPQYRHILLDELNNDEIHQMPLLICISSKCYITTIFGNSSKSNNYNTVLPAWNTSNIIEWFQKCLVKHDGSSLTRTHLHGHSSPITIARVIKLNPLLVILPRRKLQFLNYMTINSGKLFPEMKMNVYHKNISICEHFLTETNLHTKQLDQASEIVEELSLQCSISKKSENNSQSMTCERRLKMLTSIDYLRFYYKINDYLNRLLLMIYNPTIFVDNNVMQSLPSLQKIHLFTDCLKFGNITESAQLRITHAHYVEKIIEAIYHKSNIHNNTLGIIIPDESDAYVEHLKSLNILDESYDLKDQNNFNNEKANTYCNETLATVLIIDNNNESIYIMSKNFSMYNVAQFVIDYHYKLIEPIQRYSSNETSHQINDINFTNHSNSFGVMDIDSNEFRKAINTNYQNVTIVLLVYSTTCALCAGLQQTFLQVSAALRNERSLIRFMRINIYHNDLPWEFTMTYVPTLIIFPKNRYDDSVIFSSRIKPSYGNVLSFILAQMSPIDQIQLLITLCKSQLLADKRYSCWQTTKILLIEHINRYLELMKYRGNDQQIPLILERLRSLQQLSLSILIH